MRYLQVRMGFRLIAAIGIFATAPLWAQKSTVYTSPDGALRAVVVTNGTGESSTSIQSASGRVLATRDERSADGVHGHGIVHAAWTSDSRFFVASTQASGGHSPLMRPLWIYSRATGRVIDIPAGVTADFTLRNPDILETKILGCAPTDPPRTLAVRLAYVAKTGRVPIPPCAAK